MAKTWLKTKLMVDSAAFRRCCEFYFNDTTFEEAFERTGKHVCITVSASRATGGTAQRLLLNHISTPHVTLASAVGASCALPGVVCNLWWLLPCVFLLNTLVACSASVLPYQKSLLALFPLQMAPAKLLTKNSNGDLEPFEVNMNRCIVFSEQKIWHKQVADLLKTWSQSISSVLQQKESHRCQGSGSDDGEII